jgi:hypothetical protein
MRYPAAQQTGETAMADHQHGSMDITAQEKTFAGFVTFATRTVIVILVAVVLLALINA